VETPVSLSVVNGDEFLKICYVGLVQLILTAWNYWKTRSTAAGQ
jgi:hypothetical protein